MANTLTVSEAVPAAAPAAKRRRGISAILPSWSPKLVVGVSLLGLIVLWAIIGPFFVADPNAISTLAFAPPGAHGHLLGTTQVGEDVWAQIAWGTRNSLIIGVTVGLIATVLSGLFGIVTAYLGGAIDEGFALFTNVFLVIPGLPLTIIIGEYVPASARGIFLVAVVLAATSWAGGARVLRAVTLSVRSRDYVAAARVSGESAWRILVVEILPNLTPILASQLVFGIIFAILGEAGLSFLGLGANDTFTLGTILSTAFGNEALSRGAWWWFIPPGFVIALIGCALSLINFSIDEIINPKLRNSTRAQRKKWGLTPAQIKQLEQGGVK